MVRVLLALLVAATMLVSPLANADEPLDLNSASAAQLVELPGVGPKRAEEIIRFRLIHGFRRPSDLMRIKGIGRRTYLKLRPFVRVEPLQAPEVSEAAAD